MIDDLIRESGLADEWREEGMAQGMAQGERESARIVLTSRFGALNADLAAAIQAADEAVLLETLAHVATDNLEQIRARLGSS